MKKMLLGLALAVGSIASASAGEVCNVSSSYVNVRSGPSAIDYGVIDRLGNGRYVNVIGSTYNAAGYRWVKVVYNSDFGRNVGWIDSDNICE